METQAPVSTVVVDPSPFGVDGETEATVAVRGGQVVFTNGERSVAVRPSRAVVGHGTVQLTVPQSPSRLLLTFAPYDAPAPIRQRADQLGRLYARLGATGFRELLVGLRESGVPLKTSPQVRRGAAGHRANAWISASALLFVELALVGLPASALGALVSGAYATPGVAVTVALLAGLVGFLVLAVVASPVPLVVRGAFETAATRDPIRYFDNWAGRSTLRAGDRLGFVPGQPVWSAAVLLAVLALYAAWVPYLTFLAEPVSTSAPVSSGQLDVPIPVWLDGEAISVMGYAAMALLSAIFLVGLVQWRRDPDIYRIRWAPLIGAFFGFAFGQAGPGLQMNGALEVYLQVVIITMVVAFTCGRVALGFGVFAAMAVFVLLAAFGVFDDWQLLSRLLPAFFLIAAIILRYLPGGARLVAMPAERAVRMRRIVWAMWGGAIILGIGLAVAAANLIQPVAAVTSGG